MTSHITVSAEQWESGGVMCEVHNNVTGEVYTSGKGIHGNSIFGKWGAIYLGEGALHQTPAQQFAAVGDTVETFCSSSECSVDVDLLGWFLKKDSEVIALNTSCKAGPGCRVTTGRASNGDCGLTIRDVQPVDSGVYYCAEYNSYTMAMSSGSLLIITDNSAQNTTVTILAPAVSASALDSKGTLTLVCLVRGLSSPALLVQWFISGNLTETGAPSSWNEGKKGGNGESYSATSRLTIPAEHRITPYLRWYLLCCYVSL
ncbi:UNVERIFIED_CONTAM: hypothetical protein FKN15_033001 [Acipenser sinensis]